MAAVFYKKFFQFIFWPLSMWDLSSPARDQTCAPTVEAQSLNHWDPEAFLIIVVVLLYIYTYKYIFIYFIFIFINFIYLYIYKYIFIKQNIKII